MNQNDIQEWLQKNAHHYYYGIQNDPRLIPKTMSEAEILFKKDIELGNEAEKNYKKAIKFAIATTLINGALAVCNIIIFGVYK